MLARQATSKASKLGVSLAPPPPPPLSPLLQELPPPRRLGRKQLLSDEATVTAPDAAPALAWAMAQFTAR